MLSKLFDTSIFSNKAKYAKSLFLICLSSCVCSPLREWHLQETIAPSDYFSSTRLVLNAEEKCGGLQIELLRDVNGIRCALNGSSLPINTTGSGTITVTFDFDTHMENFSGEVMQGGQRVILDPSGTNRLVDALLNGESFSISVGRYSTFVIPTGFSQLFQRPCV